MGGEKVSQAILDTSGVREPPAHTLGAGEAGPGSLSPWIGQAEGPRVLIPKTLGEGRGLQSRAAFRCMPEECGL